MGINIGPKNYTQENLLFFIDAANPASYPGSGTSWFDISPNRTYGGNGCTLGGDVVPQYSTDYGGFLFVDNNYAASNVPLGPTGYIWPNIDPALSPGITLTFEMWIRNFSAGPVGEQNVISFGSRYWIAIVNPETSGARLAFSAAGIDANYGFTYADEGIEKFNAWQHMVLVVTANGDYNDVYQNKIYINGVDIPLAASSYGGNAPEYVNWSANYTFCLGFRNNSGLRQPPGDFSRMGKYDISMLRIYKGELTQDQVAQNFNSLRGRYGI
jgi:hypothetical protein